MLNPLSTVAKKNAATKQVFSTLGKQFTSDTKTIYEVIKKKPEKARKKSQIILEYSKEFFSSCVLNSVSFSSFNFSVIFTVNLYYRSTTRP